MAATNIEHSLVIQSNPSCSGLMPGVRAKAPEIVKEPNGQMRMVLAITDSGKSEISAKPDADTQFDEYRDYLSKALRSCESVELCKLYDLIMQRLHETNFNEGEIKFNTSELCDLTGRSRDNQSRVKKSYVSAAFLLGDFWFTFTFQKMTRSIHLISMIDDKIWGGFSVWIDSKVREMLREVPKMEHDPILYRIPNELYPLARKIELIAHGKLHAPAASAMKSLGEFETSVERLLSGIEIPESWTNGRNYSRRIKWLEDALDKFTTEFPFLKAWNWVDGRCANLDDERATRIHFTLMQERHKLTPDDARAKGATKTRKTRAKIK